MRRVSVRFFSPSCSKILKMVRIVGAVLVLAVAGVGAGCCAGAGAGVGVGASAGVGVGATSFRWLVLVPLVDAALFPLLEVLVI